MNRFITLFLTYAIIGIAINTLFIKIIEDNSNEWIKNLKENHIIVHLHNVYKWVGLICSLVFILFFLLMVIFPNDSAEIWVGLLFGIFILLGMYLMWASYIWKIHIYRSDNYFIYVSSFGKKYQIKYSDIIEYKNGENYIRIKTDRKTFFIDNKATNVEYLLEMLQKNKIKKVIEKK